MIITPVDVRDRIMDLCELVTLPAPYTTGTAYRDETECAWAESDFPAYVVEESGRGNEYVYSASSPKSYTTRGIFRIILYLAHICDESYTKDFDNIDYANRCRSAVIQFFACRPRLELNGSPLMSVERAEILRDTSPHTYVTRGSMTKNRTVVFNMTVEWTTYAQQTG